MAGYSLDDLGLRTFCLHTLATAKLASLACRKMERCRFLQSMQLAWVDNRCSHSASMDEYCAVCAEPIQFVGYGPCGHKEACSKCVVRLRVVLNDLRCVICQQEHDSVFITKYLGDFTQTLPAAAFSELPVGVTPC